MVSSGDAQGRRFGRGEDVGVEMLHDVEDQLQAVHEGVDGHAQHAVRGCAIVDLEDDVVVGTDAQLPLDKGGQLGVDLEGLEGRGGKARRGEGDT